jgi:DNA-binding MarR family transcriptional regulator
MATPELSEVHTAIAHLGRLAELFQKRRFHLAAGVGLTEHQWGVLEEISTEHFMPSMFAKQRASSPAAVSKTIRQLVDKGLVAVSLAEGDARQRRYDLTAKGRRVMSQLRKSRESAIEQVWMNLNQAELRSFNSLATHLSERLEALLEAEA